MRFILKDFSSKLFKEHEKILNKTLTRTIIIPTQPKIHTSNQTKRKSITIALHVKLKWHRPFNHGSMYFTIVKACEIHGCKMFRPYEPERKPSNNFDKRESVPQTPWIWSRTFPFQMPSFMSIFRGAGVHAKP